jgi:hypothetical protein
MKLGGEDIIRGADATTQLGSFSVPSILQFVKDTSDSLGEGSGITNVTEVNNIINSIIGATTINNFYDVDPNLPNAPEGSYLVMGAGGVWTYGAITAYTLPAATDSVLGGIKIGNGLTITDGVVSVDSIVIPSLDISAQDIINWDLAFSWGNHSVKGYALTTDLSEYSLTSHTHTYLPLTGGAMSNSTLVTNLNAAFLEGHAADYFSAYHTHPYLSDSDSRISHWDDAYSWGDHSLAGYLTTESAETDPIFTAWDKATGIVITASQVSNFAASVTANSNVTANTAARHSALTIGTAHGLSLSGQALSLAYASATTDGALSAYDWGRFNAMLVGAGFQLLEDQRLSTTDAVVFDELTAGYLTTTSPTDDSAILGSIAGFETGNGTIRRFSNATVQTFLGLGPNAYTADAFYLDTNPDQFIHELTSEDATVVFEDIVYDPVDATLHGIDVSVQALYRYVVVATAGSEVEVLANKPGITASFSGQTLTYVIPAGTKIVSSKIRFGAYSSLTIKTGTDDMSNSSINNRWIPMVQAWREDTRAQLMVVNVVPSASVFDEVTINGLINSTTNHIRLVF